MQFDHLKRRDFITLVGGAAAAWPLAARAQRPTKLPIIGIIDDAPIWDNFRNGLRELGYVDGRSIAIEYRSAQERPDRFVAAATELARLPVDVHCDLGYSAHADARCQNLVDCNIFYQHRPAAEQLCGRASSALTHSLHDFVCHQILNMFWKNDASQLPAPCYQVESKPKAVFRRQFDGCCHLKPADPIMRRAENLPSSSYCLSVYSNRAWGRVCRDSHRPTDG
jgi:hypothetical protein